MSLLKTLKKSLRKDDGFNRVLSKEEIEVKEYFKEINDLDAIGVASEYRMWKSNIDCDRGLTINDFFNDLTGKKKLKRKQVFTTEFKEKVMASLNSNIITPEFNER